MSVYNKIKFKTKEEWLELRRQGIGGSDIGAILGYNKYKTPLDVYNEKINGVEVEETEKMKFGKLFEPVIAEEFANRYGYKLIKPKYILQSRKYPFLIASLDYIIEKDGVKGILECKTTSSFVFKTWQNSLPLSYYLQLQHYLLVTGFEYGYIAIAINGQELEALRFEKDEEAFELIIQGAKNFYENHLLKKIPPEVVEVEEKLPEGTDEADVKIITLYNDLLDLEAERKALEDKIEAKKNELISLIGDKEIITRGGVPIIQYKLITRNVFDSKKFAEENPLIYQQYVKTTTYRTLKLLQEE